MHLTAAVVAFPRHMPVRHVDCVQANCMFCNGGLFACVRCGSFEGATTSDCPGDRMTTEQSDAVYAGQLDYSFNLGWHTGCSKHSPAYYGKGRL